MIRVALSLCSALWILRKATPLVSPRAIELVILEDALVLQSWMLFGPELHAWIAGNLVRLALSNLFLSSHACSSCYQINSKARSSEAGSIWSLLLDDESKAAQQVLWRKSRPCHNAIDEQSSRTNSKDRLVTNRVPVGYLITRETGSDQKPGELGEEK